MKNIKNLFFGMTLLIAFSMAIMSADHIDAPAVSGGTSDLADLFTFQSLDNNNLVFAVTLQGLLSPSETEAVAFDENVLIEINIDNDGDNVEDLVIQAIPRGDKMIVFGPVAPTRTGLSSNILTSAERAEVDITVYGQNAITRSSNNGLKIFAGPRDDPFFFDLGAYQAILGGTATGFDNPGSDTFAGTNVLSLVVEVPKTMLGNANSINVWVETKLKQ